MPGQTTDTAFESYVEEILLSTRGWMPGTNAEWDKERALFPAPIFASLQDTLPKHWQEARRLQDVKSKGLPITGLTRMLHALVAKVETAIKRLQEYRTALITAAVTGKIHLREEGKA